MLLSLTAIFWTGYTMVFAETLTQKHLFTLMCSGTLHLSFLLLQMIPATITNESADRTKIAIQRLPYRIPMNREELENKIRKDFSQAFHLTFWKISVFDRSFVLTCFGTFLTYGILSATLGRQ
ncbi:hypothetical protein AVEN_188892-1 [Araneus ventricosus]|uniref:Uncharacterized protein n=1 Tax=Araneus ventricosus TaxID=182803 RepID=A0A4Y2S6E4_ARAVE|nr:hypothetical protein AVEN_173941-1 [Araneus ventricosus]GBN82858.1 hypothetical protein AVEN_188892-1 [Araneus ventricosus]